MKVAVFVLQEWRKLGSISFDGLFDLVDVIPEMLLSEYFTVKAN
jgi:hypothetical protein